MIFDRDFTQTNPIRNQPLGMAGKQAIQNLTLMATQECVLGGTGFGKLDIVSVFDRNENFAACHQTQGTKQVIITVQGFYKHTSGKLAARQIHPTDLIHSGCTRLNLDPKTVFRKSIPLTFLTYFTVTISY